VNSGIITTTLLHYRKIFMSKSRGHVQRIILIFAGLAFLGGTVLTSLSLIQGNNERPNDGAPTAEGEVPTDEDAALQEQLQQQEAGYAAVLEREPENPIALQGLVQARVGLGKLEESLEPLEKLAELQPENPEVVQAIAAIHIQLQQYEEAIPPLERLIELQPENEELKQQLAALQQIIEMGGVPAPTQPDTTETEPQPEASPNPEAE
jgi:tetratricopeptide (TPR) repeat protein